MHKSDRGSKLENLPDVQGTDTLIRVEFITLGLGIAYDYDLRAEGYCLESLQHVQSKLLTGGAPKHSTVSQFQWVASGRAVNLCSPFEIY